MNIRLLPLLGVLLAVTGCASTSRVMLGQTRAPTDPALVQIYSTPPPGSIEIAQLESTSAAGFGTQGQTDAAVMRLKKEAAALGANGVILMGVESSSSGAACRWAAAATARTVAAAWASAFRPRTSARPGWPSGFESAAGGAVAGADH